MAIQPAPAPTTNGDRHPPTGRRRLRITWTDINHVGAFLAGLVSAAGVATAVYLAFLAPPSVISARLTVMWVDPAEPVRYALTVQGKLAAFEAAARKTLGATQLACVLRFQGPLVYYRISVQGMPEAPISATLWNARTNRSVPTPTQLQDNNYTAHAAGDDEGAGAAWVLGPPSPGRYYVVLQVTDLRGNLRDVVRSPTFTERRLPQPSC